MIWQALYDHSTRFKAERPSIQPSVADMVVVDNSTAEVTTLELKGRGYLVYDGDSFRPDSQSFQPLLRPWSSFDLLFFVYMDATSEAGFGVMLSCDDLPDAWFHAERNTTMELPWLTPCDEQKLSWRNSRGLALELERVLLAAQSRGRFRATRKIRSIVPPDIDADDVLVAIPCIPQPSTTDNEARRSSDKAKSWPGQGHHCSRKQFEAMVQTDLEKQLCNA